MTRARMPSFRRRGRRVLDTRPAWRTSAGRTTAPAVITEPHSAPSGGTPGGGRHPTGRHASPMMEGVCDGFLVGLCAFGNNDAPVPWETEPPPSRQEAREPPALHRGRRRDPPRHTAGVGGRGVPGGRGPGRSHRPGPLRPPRARPGPARPAAPGHGRLRRVPHHPQPQHRPHRDRDGADGHRGPGGGPGGGRRRLRHQARRHQGAGRPHPRSAAAGPPAGVRSAQADDLRRHRDPPRARCRAQGAARRWR